MEPVHRGNWYADLETKEQGSLSSLALPGRTARRLSAAQG